VFSDEEADGTLMALRVYAPSQAVLFGKLLYEFFVLTVITVFLLPLFIVLLGAETKEMLLLLCTVGAGLWGISAAGTLLSALIVGAGVRSGLFSVLMLPVILPVFIPAIRLTETAFGGTVVSLNFLGGILLYDMILSVGASILFDYIWYAE
jgi:heme exporter protein B